MSASSCIHCGELFSGNMEKHNCIHNVESTDITYMYAYYIKQTGRKIINIGCRPLKKLNARNMTKVDENKLIHKVNYAVALP